MSYFVARTKSKSGNANQTFQMKEKRIKLLWFNFDQTESEGLCLTGSPEDASYLVKSTHMNHLECKNSQVRDNSEIMGFLWEQVQTGTVQIKEELAPWCLM